MADGALVVDKPAGWTSHDVVNKVRRIAGTKRVGHLGTLDPMATGVLPLLIGKATRLAQFFLRNEKIYEGVIRFGYATSTYDKEGARLSEAVEVALDADEVERLAARFRGTFLQTPPPVSAKKIDGRKAYELARENKPVDLKPVEVALFAFDLLAVQGADVRFRAHCTAGTYIRAIAHEMGQAAGCGAFLADLRRTSSGGFTEKSARSLDELERLRSEDRLGEALIPAPALLPEIPNETVDDMTAARIRQGRDFPVSPFRTREGRHVKALGSDGSLVAIGEIRMPNLYHPVLVF